MPFPSVMGPPLSQLENLDPPIFWRSVVHWGTHLGDENVVPKAAIFCWITFSVFRRQTNSWNLKTSIIYLDLPFWVLFMVNVGKNNIHESYCWWLKSCTTWDVWNPINNGINYLSTGAGFQPSTVWVILSKELFWDSTSWFQVSSIFQWFQVGMEGQPESRAVRSTTFNPPSLQLVDSFGIQNTDIYIYTPGDSKCPFHPLFGGHLTFEGVS